MSGRANLNCLRTTILLMNHHTLTHSFDYSQCGLTMSLAKIDVGIAYAIWAAIGTATVSIAGMLLFSEGVDSIKIVSLSFIVMGVVGLNLRDNP